MRFSPQRSRDLHLVVAGMPIFSERYWQGRDFEAATLEAPLGSGPYKVGRFRDRTFHRAGSGAGLLGEGLAGQCRPEQFRPHPLRIFPRPHCGVRSLQERHAEFPGGVHVTDLGNRIRLSRACARGASRRKPSPTMRPPLSRAGTSTPGARLSRIRASARPSAWRSISSGPTPTSCSDRTSAHVVFREHAT